VITKITSTLIYSLTVLWLVSFFACKKESGSTVLMTISSTAQQGTADESGQYTLSGHISSQTPLDKITLTRQGQTSPFLIDESTAKNKKEYDYSYQVTGIKSNTTISMDVFDQKGGKSGMLFVIKK
jgi:hypothetical protein